MYGGWVREDASQVSENTQALQAAKSTVFNARDPGSHPGFTALAT